MDQQQNAWNELVQDWKQKSAEFDAQAPSEAEVMRRLNQQKRNARIEILVSLLVSLAVAGYIITEMRSGLPSVADWVVYSVLLLVTSFWGGYMLLSARHYRRSSSATTQDHIVVLLNRTKATLRALIVGRLVSLVMLTACIALFLLIAFIGLSQGLQFKHYLVAGIALGGGLLASACLLWCRKQKTVIAEQIAFLQSL